MKSNNSDLLKEGEYKINAHSEIRDKYIFI